MAQGYTPGLKVTPWTRWRCRRVLPIAGEVRVTVGAKVQAEDVIAETAMPGDATPVNIAKLLGVPAGELTKHLLIKAGDVINVGQIVAQSKGLFGLFSSEVKAPVAGTVESVSTVTGMMIVRGKPLRVQVRAYLTGTVAEVIPNEGAVIEADAAVIQGIFGIGGEAYGTIHCVCSTPDQDLTEKELTGNDLRGKIVIGGRRVTQTAIRKAQQLGVAAVVSGGIDDQDLREILGYDLGVAITGNEHIGLTIVITEGFGDIAMAHRTFDLLRRHVGQPASINGTTQIRAGVLRPEILIPRDTPLMKPPEKNHEEGQLVIGAPVRVIREPEFGSLGTVAALPSEPAMLASESKARVVSVKLARGDTVTVPRANVELIEG
ncbi:MAG TPA: hypothetical protein VFG20_07125 [Planctomycetaceae bacterium]|jgi:hypothetical protein|nr:hypothetical protein [Planctomycetaceae bacterium]